MNLFGPLPPVITDQAQIFHADCLDHLATMPANSIDSAIMDPPYNLTSITARYGRVSTTDSNYKRAQAPAAHDALARLNRGFMGKTWDTDIAFRPETWRAVMRVMKPGAHLVAFGGTRTVHKMAVAIEDAGLEIRDRYWYDCDGTEKYGPLMDSLTDDQRAAVMEMLHEAAGGSELAWITSQGLSFGDTRVKPAHEPIIIARKPIVGGSVERNQAIYGTGALNIEAGRIGTEERINGAGSATAAWRQSRVENGYRNDSGRGPRVPEITVVGRKPGNFCHDGSSDMGSAARFFYQAKADKKDRNGSRHPTVKPISLLEWLVRIYTPPGGTVMDCFAGSGTMIAAALRQGMKIVAIEKEAWYFMDCSKRVR